jgi:hypothetical protein
VVQDVWYFREKAGMAELFGAEARTTPISATTAVNTKRLTSRVLRYFITINPPE